MRFYTHRTPVHVATALDGAETRLRQHPAQTGTLEMSPNDLAPFKPLRIKKRGEITKY